MNTIGITSMDKRLIIIHLLILFMFVHMNNGVGQENTPKFEIGAFFQPNLSNRLITGDDSEIWSKYDKAKFGYYGGVKVNYSIFKRLYVGAALSYANKGFIKRIDINDLLFFDKDDPVIEELQTIKKTDTYHYLDIPFFFAYEIISYDNIEIGVEPAIKPGILLSCSGRAKEIYKDHTEFSKYDIRATNISLSGELGLNISYNLTDKYSLSFIPVFDIMLLPLYKSENNTISMFSHEERLWNLGIKTGFNFLK